MTVSGEGSSSHGLRVVSPGGSVVGCTRTLFPKPEMALDALDNILLVDERNDAHSREHFEHRSGSASHTFLINSRHFLEGTRRRSWAETSMTSTASPLVCTSSSARLARRARRKPPVVAHELEALVGNVLGDRGDKVARGEDLEVAPNLLVHAGAVQSMIGCTS